MEHGDPRNGHRYRQLRAQVRDEESTCYWCGHPISDYLQSPHPASRAMEHLQPIALGGDALARDNVAAVHRRCGEQRHAAFTTDEYGNLVAIEHGPVVATRPAPTPVLVDVTVTHPGWYCRNLSRCQVVEGDPCRGHPLIPGAPGLRWIDGPRVTQRDG